MSVPCHQSFTGRRQEKYMLFNGETAVRSESTTRSGKISLNVCCTLYLNLFNWTCLINNGISNTLECVAFRIVQLFSENKKFTCLSIYRHGKYFESSGVFATCTFILSKLFSLNQWIFFIYSYSNIRSINYCIFIQNMAVINYEAKFLFVQWYNMCVTWRIRTIITSLGNTQFGENSINFVNQRFSFSYVFSSYSDCYSVATNNTSLSEPFLPPQWSLYTDRPTVRQCIGKL